ncbi:alpha/beta fold hydrolase [Nocardioides sp. W3-2-3]|nr:alpha/beta hydrolase [Nocardioides convexus]NHA00135.1 alpha/beta fold hydrolase [Nocardioides convexus]
MPSWTPSSRGCAVVEPTATRLAGGPGSPRLLVVGPSLGTSVEALWDRAAALLAAEGYEVVGWDLPGHGRSTPTTEAFTIAGLADAVRRRAEARPSFYAGVSLGGAVALEPAVDPGAFRHSACLASAMRIGEPEGWHDRAALVRRAGTPVMVAGSAQRWFAPGFVEREPAVAARLLDGLQHTDAESYARACEALAGFDLSGRLAEARIPLLVAPGEHDEVVTAATAGETAAAAPGTTLRVLAGCGHLPPAEAPAAVVAALLEAHASVVPESTPESRGALS